MEAENIQTCHVGRVFCMLSICFSCAVQVVHQHALAMVYAAPAFAALQYRSKVSRTTLKWEAHPLTTLHVIE